MGSKPRFLRSAAAWDTIWPFDNHIETSPTLDDKSVIRYGVDGPGWTVSPSDDPKVTLTLTGEALYMKKIIISPHMNVEKSNSQ